MRVLVIGVGNPARQDDALGPALAEQLEKLAIPGVTVDADYQLAVEQAAMIAEHQAVIIADADASGAEPFSWKRCAPSRTLDFSSHGVSPQTLLGLAEEFGGKPTPTFILGIRGYQFGSLQEGLSTGALRNLAAAQAFLEKLLREPELLESLPATPGIAEEIRSSRA